MQFYQKIFTEIAGIYCIAFTDNRGQRALSIEHWEKRSRDTRKNRFTSY